MSRPFGAQNIHTQNVQTPVSLLGRGLGPDLSLSKVRVTNTCAPLQGGEDFCVRTIRMRKMLVRILLLGLILLLLIIGLIISPVGQRYLRRQVENVLSSSLTGRVEVAGARTNLWNHIDLYGITVGDTAAGGGSVAIDHIRVTYVLPALLRRHIAIRTISLSDAHLYLRQDSLERLGVAKLLTPPPEDSTGQKRRWTFSLQKLELDNIEFGYHDEVQTIDATFDSITSTVQFYQEDSLDFEVTSTGGILDTPWWSGHIDGVVMKGSMNEREVKIHEADIRGPTIGISLEGSIPLRDNGQWDVAARLQTNLESMSALQSFAPDRKVQGEVVAMTSLTGSRDHPAIYLDATGHGFNLDTITIDSLLVKSSYLEDETLHATCRFHGEKVSGDIKATIAIPFTSRPLRIGTYDLHVQVDSLDTGILHEFFPLPLQAQNGTIEALLTAQGQGLDSLPDDASLSAQITGWKGLDSSSYPLTTDLSLKKGIWQLQLSWGSNYFVGEGQVDRTGNLSATVSADINRPDLFASYIIGEQVDGYLHAQGDIAGSFTDPTIDLQIEGDSLIWRSIVGDTLWALIHWRSGNMEILGASAEIAGEFDPVLKRLGINDAGGRGRIVAMVKGDMKCPWIHASLTGSDLYIRAFRTDSLCGDFSLVCDTLTWHDLRVRRDSSVILGDGHAELSKTPVFKGDFRLTTFDSLGWTDSGSITCMGSIDEESLDISFGIKAFELADLSPWLPLEQELAGLLSAEVTVSGTQTNPAGTANITIDHPTYAGKEVASVSVISSIRERIVSAEGSIALSDTASLLRFQARLPLHPAQPWAIHPEPSTPALVSVGSDTIQLAALSKLMPQGMDLAGSAAINLSLGNRGETWLWGGGIQVYDGYLRYEPEKVTITELSADVALSGPPANPYATFNVATGQIEHPAATIDRSSWSGELTRERLSMDGGYISLRDGHLQLSGSVPLKGADTLHAAEDLTLQLDVERFPIALVNPFLDHVVVHDGIIRGSIHVSGGPRSPSLDGNLTLTQGQFTVRNLTPPLGPISGEWLFSGTTITIRRLDGIWGQGEFHSNGMLTLGKDGIEHTHVIVNGKNLRFVVPDLAMVHLESTDLRFNDADERFRLAGKVVLGETRIIRGLRMNDLVSAIQGTRAPTREPIHFLKKLDVEVEVLAPQSLIVDVNVSKMRLDGRLSIGPTAVPPSFTGDIGILEGYVLYLDRKFTIVRGTFRQYDPYRINPEIDFEAFAEVRPYSAVETPTTYRVTLRVSGDMDHPELTLVSDPPLSQPDIVSLLTLGRIRSTDATVATGDEPGLGRVLVERAQAITSGQVTRQAERRIERLLNLESVTIEGNLFKINEDWAPRVTTTKRLAERLDLSYQTVVGHTNEQRVKLSYRLTRIFYLDGETDQRGRAGLDVRARFRFK
jgi:autotransporter translocation and assembly factor TamB